MRLRTRLVKATRVVEKVGAGVLLLAPILGAITRIPQLSLLVFAAGFLTLGSSTLIHFVTLPTEFDASFNRDDAPMSQEALAEAASQLLGDTPCQVEVVTGKAGESIAAAAAADDIDLVVIGTRGLSAVESLLLGSVAEHVMRTSPVPLLAVRG